MTNRKFERYEAKEIKRRWAKAQKRKIKDSNALRRLQVLHLRVIGKSNAEISEIVGYSKQYIIEIVSKYRKEGMEAILVDKRTGNNRKLSFNEEAEFLDQFYDLAEAGQLVTIHTIIAKYEERTGGPCANTTIYRMLKRHGWRKISPRPAHPGKASEEDIEASKKLTKNSGNSCWKKIEGTSGTKPRSSMA
jgi:transposase